MWREIFLFLFLLGILGFAFFVFLYKVYTENQYPNTEISYWKLTSITPGPCNVYDFSAYEITGEYNYYPITLDSDILNNKIPINYDGGCLYENQLAATTGTYTCSNDTGDTTGSCIDDEGNEIPLGGTMTRYIDCNLLAKNLAGSDFPLEFDYEYCNGFFSIIGLGPVQEGSYNASKNNNTVVSNLRNPSSQNQVFNIVPTNQNSLLTDPGFTFYIQDPDTNFYLTKGSESSANIPSTCPTSFNIVGSNLRWDTNPIGFWKYIPGLNVCTGIYDANNDCIVNGEAVALTNIPRQYIWVENDFNYGEISSGDDEDTLNSLLNLNAMSLAYGESGQDVIILNNYFNITRTTGGYIIPDDCSRLFMISEIIPLTKI